MYNNPVGGVAAGFGGAASVPFLGGGALWLALGLFTVGAAVVAVKRILPRTEA